jgi:flagellar biosynthesis/type III secretory pathway protein FliH
LRTPDGFTSLAATLLAPSDAFADTPVIDADAQSNEEQHLERRCDEAELIRDVRLFHARISEALEGAVERLLYDVAAEVVARDLQLAPVDVERIVDRTLQRYFSEDPLRVRVHSEDAALVQCGVPVVADDSLAQGDVIVELRDGFLDATLGVRLEAVLRAAKP